MFKPSGTQPCKRQSSKAARLVMTLSAMSLLTLTGCATLTSATNLEAQCSAWRKITYYKQDTKNTVRQVRVHNATGRNLGCWD